MAKGLICDACQAFVAFDATNGRESDSGEESAWIVLTATNVRDMHACTRECAKNVLDGPWGQEIEAAYAAIAEIARAVREYNEADRDD